jgi:hypothetical protein
MAGNIDTLTLASTTLANYSKTLIDNVFEAIPLTAYLKAKKGRSVDGGEPIKTPLIYAKNTTFKPSSKRAVIDTTEQDIITEANYYWKIITGSVSLAKFDLEVLNRGSAKLIDILKPQMQVAELSLTDQIDKQLHTGVDYELTANGWDVANCIWGLYDMVNSADPTVANYGGIDRDTYTWWKSNVVVSATTYGTSDLMLSSVNNMYNTGANGRDKPDLGLCGQAQYERLEDLLGDKVMRNDWAKGAGFEAIEWKGMTIMLDKSLDSGYAASADLQDDRMYFLNSKYIDFIEAQDWNPQITPFMTIPNQPTKVAQILWAGQLICSNCARQGVINTLTTSY